MENKEFRTPDPDSNDAWNKKEEQRTDGYKRNLKFERPNAKQLEEEAKLHASPRRKYQHEGHESFRMFYSSMDYDQRTEFGSKPPEEKERIFLEWVDEQKKKTA